jgi:hypothetical protein
VHDYTVCCFGISENKDRDLSRGILLDRRRIQDTHFIGTGSLALVFYKSGSSVNILTNPLKCIYGFLRAISL